MSVSSDLPGRGHRLRAFGLLGAVLCAGLAAALWFGANVAGARECHGNGYGLSVEGGTTMTEQGCVVSVPTKDGVVRAALPTRADIRPYPRGHDDHT